MHKECLNPNSHYVALLPFKRHTDSILVSNIDTTVRTGIYESSAIPLNQSSLCKDWQEFPIYVASHIHIILPQKMSRKSPSINS